MKRCGSTILHKIFGINLLGLLRWDFLLKVQQVISFSFLALLLNFHFRLGTTLWIHPLRTYAKFSEKLTFLTPCVRIRRLEMLVFRKILRTYLMDEPYACC